MATRYFKTDNRRMTYRECWDMAPGLAKPVLVFARLFRLPIKLSAGTPLPDREQEYQVPPEEIIPEARARMADALARMEALGFHSPQFVTARDSLMLGVYAAVVSMLHRSGEMLGHVCYSRTTLVHPAQEKLHCGFETLLDDGRCLSTTNGPRSFQPVAGSESVYLPGKPIEETFRRHQPRLADPAVRNFIRRADDVAALWAQREEGHQRTTEERLRRGVWVLMTPEEIAALRATLPSPPPSPDAPPRAPGEPPPLPPDPDEPVLAELEKLQNPKQSWGKVLLVFGVSLALFLGAGWLQWNWRFALTIVPVLFLHELGHYVAMRCFRYQNLRMFFIPFFGAAVSGLRLQVPGWKKAVVALAGPLPGIAIGAVMAFVAWRTDTEWLRKPAQLFLIVNGFNLLPLMPLDGGRVFDALFFVRSRTAETIALVIAAAGMLALSIALSTKVLMFVGIAMFVGMPHLLRVARVAERARQKGFTPDPEDAPAISRAAAKAILPEVRAVLPAMPPLGAKPIAQIVMNVYERLHTSAPGWPATVALLLAHGAAVAVTLVALVFEPLLSGIKQGLDGTPAPKPAETRLVFDCAGAVESGGNTAVFLANRVTIAASSPDPAELREAFDELLAADTNAALTLCGQTLFIAATNVGRAWESAVFKTLSGERTATVLERRTDGRWRPLVTHVRATAPDEEAARKLAEELESRFTEWTGELAVAGVTQQKGREVTLRGLQFTRLDRGLPALLRFLCEQGCESVRYGLDPGVRVE